MLSLVFGESFLWIVIDILIIAYVIYSVYTEGWTTINQILMGIAVVSLLADGIHMRRLQQKRKIFVRPA